MFRDFFYMPKSDRRIILSALAIIGVAAAVIVLAGGRDKAPGSTAATQANASQKVSSTPEVTEAPLGLEAPSSSELFPFDPNTADSTTLLRLGLVPWQVRNIYKYRAAGGIYRSKEDFASRTYLE